MIQINDSLSIPDGQVTEWFARAVGDRRQNLVKNATAVELRLHIGKSSMPLKVKARLRRIAGKHVTTDGLLRIVSRSSKSQATNRLLARTRLVRLLKRAATPLKTRIASRPSLAEREARLAAKHLRAAVKRLRKPSVD